MELITARQSFCNLEYAVSNHPHVRKAPSRNLRASGDHLAEQLHVRGLCAFLCSRLPCRLRVCSHLRDDTLICEFIRACA